MSIKYEAGPELESVSPRAFTIAGCQITSNDGNTVQIETLIHNVKIHESLNMSGMVVEIFIADAANLFTHMNLAGNEKVELVLFRTEPGNNLKEFSLVLQIVDITDFSEPTPSTKSYTLICMSPHVYHDKEKLLNLPFNGTTNSLIDSIVKSNLNTTVDIRSSTKSSIKGIYPNISPLNAISWLLRNSFDNNTQVYFYETAKEGLVLTSYDTLLDQDLYEVYNRVPYNTQSMDLGQPEKVFDEERLKIIKFSSSLNMSKMEKLEAGAFGSTINSIDIATKTIEKPESYQYGKDMVGLNTIPVLSAKMNVEGKSLVKDFKKFKQYYVSKNSLAFGSDKNNYHAPISESLLSANAYFQNLDTVDTKLTLPGDFDMTPGKIIYIMAPVQADITLEMSEGIDYLDTFLTGHYMVSTVVHNFSEKDGYTMQLNLKKDSFIAEYEKIKKPKEVNE